MNKKTIKTETQPTTVWCIATSGGIKNSKLVFKKLEERIGCLRGRKFYGVLEGSPKDGVYRACVAKKTGDDFSDLESWVVPGGQYLKVKINDWANNLDLIGTTFSDMAKVQNIDESRPSIEYYRSSKELILFLPFL